MPNPNWYEKAKPACSVVPIRRFVTDDVFALKNGGYGCMFELEGIDEEGLTDEAVADALKCIEGALKSLPENGRVYQYTRVREGFEIPRQATYDNSQVQDAIRTRIAFLESNAGFRRIELFWAITVEPAKKDSFASKTLSPEQYARQTARLIAQVERNAEVFAAQLAGTLHPRLLEKDEVASFFAYLVNLEPWSLDISLTSPERVDRIRHMNPVAGTERL